MMNIEGNNPVVLVVDSSGLLVIPARCGIEVVAGLESLYRNAGNQVYYVSEQRCIWQMSRGDWVYLGWLREMSEGRARRSGTHLRHGGKHYGVACRPGHGEGWGSVLHS